jgi:hypothetical protein
MSKGGKREGAGRPKGPATFVYSIRTTREGWQWLNRQAIKGQMLSVGGWAREEAAKAAEVERQAQDKATTTSSLKPSPEPATMGTQAQLEKRQSKREVSVWAESNALASHKPCQDHKANTAQKNGKEQET